MTPAELAPPASLGADAPPDFWQTPACGQRHSGCITAGGIAYTWGRGENGRLGHGKGNANELAPRPLLALRALTIEVLAMGRVHTVVVTSNKAVYAWGGGLRGQCGPSRNDLAEPAVFRVPSMQV